MKEFIKGTLYVAQELVTLGGHGRLLEAREAYEDLYAQIASMQKEYNEHRVSIEREINNVGASVIEAKRRLEVVIKLGKSTDLGVSEGKIAHESTRPHVDNLETIRKFNTAYQSAYSTFTAGAGATVGVTTAVGAWALVAAFGAASTGTAISGLSGVAATNAILAWFGGGALAAGGAGMSGGLMVLGGIIALPAVYFAAKGSHKKAEELEGEIETLRVKLPEIEVALESIRIEKVRVMSSAREVIRRCDAFGRAFEVGLAKVYPHGAVSKLYQALCRLFRRSPYSVAQLNAIKELASSASDFCRGFDRG